MLLIIVGRWMMLISKKKKILIKFILLVGVVEALKSSRSLLLFIGGLTFLIYAPITSFQYFIFDAELACRI